MAKRIALIIANHTYQDSNLAGFVSPPTDVATLAEVLRHPALGNFTQVETLVDQSAQELRQRVSALFHWKQRPDELVLYWVGHGLIDPTGQLYLLTADTRQDALTDTALPAAFITHWLDRSFSRHKIVVLDAAFNRLAEENGGTSWQQVPLLQPLDLGQFFKGRGHGRTVLAANRIPAGAGNFTEQLIQALQSGAADANQDGQIDLDELLQYLIQQAASSGNLLTPRQWRYNHPDKFIIARNPHHFVPARPVKWDLIVGAIMTPTTIIAIGGSADLRTSVGMAGLFLLLYALLYLAHD